MAKNQFKFKLKITGFELEVEGSKEDVAAITSSVTNQIKGLTNPQILGDNNDIEDADSTDVTPPELPSPQKKRTNRRKSPSVNSSISKNSQKIDQIDFKNDPTKYGTPLMKWTMQQKALWLLYVLKKEKGLNELTLGQIVTTFNKHFQHSKVINRGNVSRDLGKVTLGKSALVQGNATNNPATWYLTYAGEVFVQNLIAETKA